MIRLRRLVRRLSVAAALTVCLATAGAQEALPGWSARGGLVGGTNPTVFGAVGGVTHTTPLYPERDGVLWDSARLETGIDLLLNPSFTDIGARFFVEPIAVFDLTLRFGARTFYDTFGLGLASLDGYGETPPAASGEDYAGASGVGWFVGASPRLKLAVGPIVAANTFTATRYDFRSSDTSFLEEPLTLSAVERTDWVLENEALLLYRLQNVPASFSGIGPSYRVTWTPAALDIREPSQRLAVSGVYAFEPTDRVTVQAAVFLGMY
ncbi:MAG: hypothetical protein MI724_15210, partial [Spirochaetales bacterium]|nr:hypothetical protein [Spirochaetales bacterium]